LDELLVFLTLTASGLEKLVVCLLHLMASRPDVCDPVVSYVPEEPAIVRGLVMDMLAMVFQLHRDIHTDCFSLKRSMRISIIFL
jgi:hypothetical protein